MSERTEQILQHFLSLTQLLEQLVNRQDEPDELLALLEQRQNAINSISERLADGEVLTEEQKQKYLVPAYTIQKQLEPALEMQKQEIESKLLSVQKGKLANQQYNGYGDADNLYGAFFDKRK